MSIGLGAPASVPVEVRGEDGRYFRLSRQIGPGGIDLLRPAPFELGRPVEVRFTVPEIAGHGAVPLVLRARVDALGEEVEVDGDAGGCALRFLEPPGEARDAIARYVAKRLGLPPL